MSILSVDNISPIGSGTSVTVNSAATLVLTNANSTGVITATSFVGSGANLTGLAGGGTGLDLNDNVKLRLGTGNDLAIFHDGSNSKITNATGHIVITTNSLDINNAADNETLAKFDHDGAVELYYNNSKKLETTSSGITLSDQLQVNGSVFASAGLKINADNQKLRIGASDDLELYHDGSNSRIADVGTGYLINTSNGDGILFQHSSGQNLAKFFTGGAVELYHNFNKKFETMSTGARIQGGLLFNSDTAAANTLDDYEEGTWTPDWRGSQALGTTSYGSYNAASYVKIGNQVTVRGHSQITGSSGGQGFWFINNLPFTCGGGDDRRYRSVGSVFIENFNFQDSETDILCFIERNNNDMQLRGNRDNLSGSPNIRVGMDSSFDVMWTITYPTT